MNLQNLTNSLAVVIYSALSSVINYLPNLIGGLIILLLGFLVAMIVNRVVISLLKAIKLDNVLAKYNLSRVEGQEVAWSHILSELARWSIIVVFLFPAVEAWRITNATAVLNQILGYLPNVIVAVIISLLGLIFARLGSDIVYSASKNLGKDTAHLASLISRWAIVGFSGLVILNQLGIGAELVRILFAGIVAMLAIAGGIAFGLGGTETAKDILNSLRERLKAK